MKQFWVGMVFVLVVAWSGSTSSASISEVSEEYQDWAVMNGDGKPHRYNAITMASDNEGYLVYSCHVGSTCYLTMLADATCTVGSEYPMLFNSDSGAASVSATCIEIHEDLGAAEYSIDDPGSVLAETVFTDMKIGIAIPLADGKFTAVRFSLMGSQEAMARAYQLATNLPGKAVESGEF